ncbi:MAG: hypothetical protein Unbinned176contig1000_25 [Prokaryotic dsDNA virus sp.]|nr:MAG: hypothetical protein Unbinned176contig1000_25 [Prokaryotic dsDNA virus sp.]|tara:strand:+ start:15745 stop:16296 length:552 start_codon:yes stop_codon:yes gene_type:complete
MIVKNINDERDVLALCDIATKVCGLNEGDLIRKDLGSKAEKYTVPRTIVAVIARKDLKIHYKVIADVLHKDRTSIYHYENKHKSDYATYPKYRNYYNEIFNIYSKIKENKKDFKSKSELIRFLKDNGIENVGKENLDDFHIAINIITDDFKTSVNCNYTEFSDVYDKCNEVLDNYNIRIYIST